MGLAAQTIEYYDNGGGPNLKASPTKVAEDEASVSLNIDYSTDGALYTRNGSSIMNVSMGLPDQISGAPIGLNLYDFRKSDGTVVQIYCAGTSIYHSMTSPTAEVTSLSAAFPIPDLETFVGINDEFCIWGNGIDGNLKFNGTDWTNLSLPRPPAPVPVDNGAGTLGAGSYDYYISDAVLDSGVIVQEGELSPVGSVTIGASRQIRVPLTVSGDSQVNARVIYRRSPTSAGMIYRLTTVADNTSTFYDDNTLADGTILAEFDNQAAPTSAVFEEYGGAMFYVDAEKQTDVYISKSRKPWNVPTENLIIFDGPVKCIKRFYGALIFGTDRSIWVLNGDWTQQEPRRVSSIIGIVNNRCAVGESYLYILGTNRKVYKLSPTDFSQSEVRIDDDISFMIDRFLSQINANQTHKICMEYYTKANVAQVVISAPITTSNNDTELIYNEIQSVIKKKPVWQIKNNRSPATIRQMIVDGEIGLYGGDYNGFIWNYDDQLLNGDGTEDNATVTSATSTTLTDSSKNWVVDAYVGMPVQIISGIGEDQRGVVASNTSDTLTLLTALGTTPTAGAEFTIGGYDSLHFSNWKYVLGTYDILKQLWALYFNANASGNYPISLILQTDFDQSENNQINIALTLTSGNTIWGAFIWGLAVWGAQSVFQDRLRQFARFRAIRFGFRSRKAGQPFQINGFSLQAQNKGQFWPAAD